MTTNLPLSALAVVVLLTPALPGVAGPVAAQSRPLPKAPAEAAPTNPNVPQGNPKTFPTNISWIAESVEGKPLPAGTEAGFKVNTQFRAEGFSGCNTFSAAAYPQQGQGFIVGPIAMTKKECGGNQAALEKVFLPAFKFAVGWTQENESELTLKTRGGTLRFRRGI